MSDGIGLVAVVLMAVAVLDLVKRTLPEPWLLGFQVLVVVVATALLIVDSSRRD